MKERLLSMLKEARERRLLLLFVLLMSAVGTQAEVFTKTYNYFWTDTQSYDWKNYFCADPDQELGCAIGTLTDYTICSPKKYYRVSSVKVVAGVIAGNTDFEDANVTVSVNGQPGQVMTVLPSSQYPNNDFSQLNTIPTEEFTFSFADEPLENAEVAVMFSVNTNPQYDENGGIDLYVQSVTVTYESNMTVGGVLVTQENMGGIIGDNIEGTVTYDEDTNTLTLTNANIKSGGIQTDDDLTIAAIGSPNYINGFITTTKENATLTFKNGNDDEAALHALQINQSYTDTKSGFSTVNYDGLYLTADNDRNMKYSSKRQRFEYSNSSMPSSVKFSSAETYELWVGGVKVTKENKDAITSDFLTATESGSEYSVSYNPDSHRLSLKNVTLSGSGITNYGIISRLPELTISIEGANEIICNDTCTAIRADADMEQKLTFTTAGWFAENCTLAFKARQAVRDFDNVELSYYAYIYWNNSYEYRNGKLVDCEGNEVTDKSAMLSDTEYYGLSVGGVDVTDKNASNITGGAIVSGKFSYDYYNHVLTIDGSDSPAVINSTEEYGILNKTLSDLTVKLKGKCTIDMSESETTNPIYSLAKSDNGVTLNLVKDEDYAGLSSLALTSNQEMEQSVISGFTNVDFSSFATTSAKGTSIQVDYDEYVLWKLDEEDEPAGYATDVIFVPAYNLWVNGQQVTDSNKDALLSNYLVLGSIQFDNLSKTLTLNNVDGVEFNSDVSFIVNGLGNMTIHIVGKNELYCGRLFLTQDGQGESTYDATFTTDPANPGSLTIKNTSNEGGDWYTGHTLTLRNELTLSQTPWNEQDGFSLATIEVSPEVTLCGLVVGGVTVTPDNAANIAEGIYWIEVDDGGELSFNPESNTLTMKDVTITMPDMESAPYPAIVSGLDHLTVHISGYNSLNFSSGETYGIQSTNANGELVITKETVEENARLYIGTSKPAFDGFKSVTYENGLVYDKNNMTVEGLETPSPYANYNYREKALQVGMEYAPIDGVTVYYSIDYVDASKQDVENAVYERGADLFISSPCTFTAYSQYGEYTSSVFKAKVFAFEESEVTAQYGVDETVNAPALLPEIDDADRITVRYIEYTEAVAPAFEPNANNPVAVATINEETGVMTINKPGTIKFAADCYSEVVDCWNLGEDDEATFVLTVNDVDHGIIIKKGDVAVSVTNTNRLDVLGDADLENEKPASVQFDGRSRLVLNAAELTSIVVSDENDLPASGLEIYLEGNSKISNDLGYAVKSEYSESQLDLALHTGADAPGTLEYTNNGAAPNNVFEAFDVTYYNKLGKFVEGQVTTVRIPMDPITDDITEPAIIDYGNGTGYSEGTTVNNTEIANVLYTLNDNGTPSAPDGFVSGVGGKLSLIINSTITDLEVEASDALVPGTSAYYGAYQGLTFIVPASTGVITLYNVVTENGYAFHVRVGNQPPVEVTTADVVDVPYACSDVSYVKIYLVDLTPGQHGAPALANDGRRIGPKSTVSGGLGGMSVSSGYISSGPNAAAAYYCMAQGDFGADGSHGIRVNNPDVTDLPLSAFESAFSAAPSPRRAPNANAKSYIDASHTMITGKSFSRTDGAFKDIPEETIIYLPAGNTATGKNFVIGGICDNLDLKATRENAFEVADDFTAAQATFDREFAAGDVDNKKYYTIFLPYALKLSEVDGELFEFVKYESATETVEMAKVVPTSDNKGMTTPNKAYFYMPNNTAALKPALSTEVKKYTGLPALPGADVEAEGLHGVYEYYKWNTKPENIYCYSATDKDGIKAGEFAKVGEGTHIKPFRAYLRIDSNSAPEFLSINWGDGTTSIVPLDKEQVRQDADGWYTITGFRLPNKPTEKGIYIHNNHKIVVK